MEYNLNKSLIFGTNILPSERLQLDRIQIWAASLCDTKNLFISSGAGIGSLFSNLVEKDWSKLPFENATFAEFVSIQCYLIGCGQHEIYIDTY